MIIKMMMADYRCQIFDNIKTVGTSNKSTYCPIPPDECYDDDEKLAEFINGMINDKEPGLKCEGRHKRAKNVFMSENDVQAEFERKYIFAGEIGGDEKHCFKIVHFIHYDKEVILYTQYPVYLCDDKGNTVEVVK